MVITHDGVAMSDERNPVIDSAWASFRDAVPAFVEPWAKLSADEDYDETLSFANAGELARFVVHEMLVQRADELPSIGAALEAFYTEVMIRDDDTARAIVTIGFLEGIIECADDAGIALAYVRPMLTGERTREEWDRAIAWQKPGFEWDGERGTVVPTQPLPTPVGTVRVHRGWVDEDGRTGRMDVRLLSGAIEAGHVLRTAIDKHHWSSFRIDTLARRSADLPDEYHVTVVLDREPLVQLFEMHFHLDDEWFWQVVVAPGPLLEEYDDPRPGV